MRCAGGFLRENLSTETFSLSAPICVGWARRIAGFGSGLSCPNLVVSISSRSLGHPCREELIGVSPLLDFGFSGFRVDGLIGPGARGYVAVIILFLFAFFCLFSRVLFWGRWGPRYVSALG